MPCRADRLEFDYVDLTDADVLPASFKSNTKLVFLETPTNPTMKVADIASVAEAAHAHGAVLERVRLVLFAESLGGTESLVTYRLCRLMARFPGRCSTSWESMSACCAFRLASKTRRTLSPTWSRR